MTTRLYHKSQKGKYEKSHLVKKKKDYTTTSMRKRYYNQQTGPFGVEVIELVQFFGRVCGKCLKNL